MQRALNQLSQFPYDILIVGGGIYGVCVARDAALRGLSVALVDQGDFGSATSSNSLRIVHGGLRYLQQADFRRMRRHIYERRALMRIAPHLVHPLPFLMPTYGHRMRGKEIMRLALAVNDLVSFDRNRLADPQKHLPRGRVISRRECVALFPGVQTRGLTGGAIWYDGQMYNSERLLLATLHSAVQAGAEVANYTEAIGFLRQDDRIVGIRARDVQTDETFDIRAKMVINTAGPWVERVLGLLDDRPQQPRVLLSKAMNLVVKRQLIPTYAVGISNQETASSPKASRNPTRPLYFITPWQRYSLIGTTHVPYAGTPEACAPVEKEVEAFVQDINAAYPAAQLKRDDIGFVHTGLLPMHRSRVDSVPVNLKKRFQIYDYKQACGIDGLLSVVSVKYTTARDVAQRVVDLVCKRFGGRFPASVTATTPVYGGHIERFEAMMQDAVQKQPCGLSPAIVRHLVYTYGSAYTRVVAYVEKDPQLGQTLSDTSAVIRAEVLHGIREEMAQTLSDVVFRRTELGSAGNPGESCLQACAAMMATEMGWNAHRTQRETEAVRAPFSTQATSQ